MATSIASTIAIQVSDQNSPAYTRPAYHEMSPEWVMVDDLLGGTPAMRAASDSYLVKNPSENAEEYKARLDRSELFNGLRRALNALTGQVFRAPVAFAKDTDSRLVSTMSNIDGAGRTLHSFARNLFYKALGYGHMGVLVDFPRVDGAGGLTLAAERNRGLRPYWIAYHPRNILNWRTQLIDSQEVTTLLTLREQTSSDDGQFAAGLDWAYNVYRLDVEKGGEVTYQRWEKDSEGKLVETDKPAIITNQTRIPFVPLYVGEQFDEFYSQTPMLDLLFSNVAHWNVQSDHRHSLHMASVPIPVFAGMSDKQKKFELGPNLGIHIPKGGKAYFMEHKGEALSSTRQELRDLEARMLMHAMGMLEKTTNQAETAEARRLDRDEQDSVLSDAARALKNCLQRCGEFHMNYYSVADVDVVVEVNTDFEESEMTIDEMNFYSTMVERGQLSKERMWTVMQAGGRLGEDFNPIEEARRLEDEVLPPVGQGDLFGEGEGEGEGE